MFNPKMSGTLKTKDRPKVCISVKVFLKNVSLKTFERTNDQTLARAKHVQTDQII